MELSCGSDLQPVREMLDDDILFQQANAFVEQARSDAKSVEGSSRGPVPRDVRTKIVFLYSSDEDENGASPELGSPKGSGVGGGARTRVVTEAIELSAAAAREDLLEGIREGRFTKEPPPAETADAENAELPFFVDVDPILPLLNPRSMLPRRKEVEVPCINPTDPRKSVVTAVDRSSADSDSRTPLEPLHCSRASRCATRTTLAPSEGQSFAGETRRSFPYQGHLHRPQQAATLVRPCCKRFREENSESSSQAGVGNDELLNVDEDEQLDVAEDVEGEFMVEEGTGVALAVRTRDGYALTLDERELQEGSRWGDRSVHEAADDTEENPKRGFDPTNATQHLTEGSPHDEADALPADSPSAVSVSFDRHSPEAVCEGCGTLGKGEVCGQDQACAVYDSCFDESDEEEDEEDDALDDALVVAVVQQLVQCCEEELRLDGMVCDARQAAAVEGGDVASGRDSAQLPMVSNESEAERLVEDESGPVAGVVESAIGTAVSPDAPPTTPSAPLDERTKRSFMSFIEKAKPLLAQMSAAQITAAELDIQLSRDILRLQGVLRRASRPIDAPIIIDGVRMDM